MKPTFILNNRNKAPHVYKAVAGALSQTVPCEILISDFQSTDNSLAEIKRAVAECKLGADHDVTVVTCPLPDPQPCMRSANEHMQWMFGQTKGEFIFQCSSDDFSLPDRVKVCMAAVEKNPCDAVATTMYFQKPGEDGASVSGFPQQSGYVKAGEGLMRLAYGSVIAGYSREFLEKVGDAGANTVDVLWGYLAALGKGFYVEANPQHVHVLHSDAANTGFGGKLLAATGDEVFRVAELNHAQLCRLYVACATKVQEFHPDGIDPEDWMPIIQMIVGQASAWVDARMVLTERQIVPGMLP